MHKDVASLHALLDEIVTLLHIVDNVRLGHIENLQLLVVVIILEHVLHARRQIQYMSHVICLQQLTILSNVLRCWLEKEIVIVVVVITIDQLTDHQAWNNEAHLQVGLGVHHKTRTAGAGGVGEDALGIATFGNMLSTARGDLDLHRTQFPMRKASNLIQQWIVWLAHDLAQVVVVVVIGCVDYRKQTNFAGVLTFNCPQT